jgi:hypothetical protein
MADPDARATDPAGFCGVFIEDEPKIRRLLSAALSGHNCRLAGG